MSRFGSRNTPTTPSGAGKWYQNPESRENTRLGRFELKECLGKGGFAVVYLARDTKSLVDREVVIKILYIDDENENEEIAYEKIRRFVVESAAFELLTNVPGFVVKLEGGELPARSPQEIDQAKARRVEQLIKNGKDFYLVFQYMSNGNLSDRLTHGPLDPDEAVQIAIKMALALSGAHDKGLLHRDIKPSNILFDMRNEPKLADFGLAKFIKQKSLSDITTPIGDYDYFVPAGTAGFVPPESFYGRDTIQRDIYALGITLLEMLTGFLPNLSSSHYQDWKPHVADRVEQVQPPHLRAIVERAIAEKPNERYQKMSELADALRVYSQNSGVTVAERLQSLQDLAKGIWQQAQPMLSSAGNTGTKMAGKMWSRVRQGVDGISLDQIRLPNFDQSPIVLLQRYGERVMIALAMWATLYSIFIAWPTFYGEGLSFFLALLLGILSLFWPWRASFVAWAALCALLFALSPLLGTIAIILLARASSRLHAYAPKKQEESLFFAWLLLLALPLVTLDMALAIPIAIGAYYKKTRRGLAVGMLTYFLLSLWATLQDEPTLGSTMLFDAKGVGIPWYLDTTADIIFRPRAFLTFLRSTVSNWEKTLHFGRLTYQLWTSSIVPLLSLLIWGSVGFLAAFLARLPRFRASTYQVPAVLLSVLAFGSLTWLMLYLLQLQRFVAKSHLLVAGFLSAIAAIILIALIKQIKG